MIETRLMMEARLMVEAWLMMGARLWRLNTYHVACRRQRSLAACNVSLTDCGQAKKPEGEWIPGFQVRLPERRHFFCSP